MTLIWFSEVDVGDRVLALPGRLLGPRGFVSPVSLSSGSEREGKASQSSEEGGGGREDRRLDNSGGWVTSRVVEAFTIPLDLDHPKNKQWSMPTEGRAAWTERERGIAQRARRFLTLGAAVEEVGYLMSRLFGWGY